MWDTLLFIAVLPSPLAVGGQMPLGRINRKGQAASAVKPLLFPGVHSHKSCPGSAQEPSGRRNNLKLKHPLTSLAADQQEKPRDFVMRIFFSFPGTMGKGHLLETEHGCLLDLHSQQGAMRVHYSALAFTFSCPKTQQDKKWASFHLPNAKHGSCKVH